MTAQDAALASQCGAGVPGTRVRAGDRLVGQNIRTTVIGRYDDADFCFDVGVRLEMDRQMRALQVVFVRDKKTIGYIPIEVKDTCFALRGMSVSDQQRGRGLSLTFLAIFLDICSRLGVSAITNKIDKPIISLVLQKFGFEAVSTVTEVEVAAERGAEGQILVWSANTHQISSQFSKRFLREQHMILATERPAVSQTVYVNTVYRPADFEAACRQARELLAGRLSYIDTERSSTLIDALRFGGWPSWASRQPPAPRTCGSSRGKFGDIDCAGDSCGSGNAEVGFTCGRGS
mmetsp:Transcript_79931/g.222695  ORF Transcript_79931/g.222695 Transcript_79931/m.222695 type:complete len:290 (+) Transcript_79931:145-1014(+)